MTTKQLLVDFLQREIKEQGGISLKELSRRMQEKGYNITPQKLWRWAVVNVHDFPSVEDLEQFAEYKGLELPEFLVRHLGYPAPRTQIDIEAAIDEMNVAELSTLALKISAILNRYTAYDENIPVQKRLKQPTKIRRFALAGHQVEKLGVLLEKSLLARHWSHEDAAKISGIPLYVISSLIYNPKGNQIPEGTFNKIARLVCQVEDLRNFVVNKNQDYGDRPSELLALLTQETSLSVIIHR